jgi:hypothetical protein
MSNAPLSVHERAAESIRRKIHNVNEEIDKFKVRMSSLEDRNPERATLLLSVKERQNKLCGCERALEKEMELMSKPSYPPGVIGSLTTFGYCFPYDRLDPRPYKNPDWHRFDYWFMDKYYINVIDTLQENLEKGNGGLFYYEIEEKILDMGFPIAWLWVGDTVNKFSNPMAGVEISFVPERLFNIKNGGMPKSLKLRKKNKNGLMPKPSYHIPINKALNVRFGWSNFAACQQGLDPNETLMRKTSLWRIHQPELRSTGYKERDSKAADLIEEAARKGARIQLEQAEHFNYSKPFPQRAVCAKDPLTYYVNLPDSKTFLVDSPNAYSETKYSADEVQISYNDAFGLINDAWEKQLEKMNIAKEKFGRF